MTDIATRGGWVPVKKSAPCLKCGGDHWCTRTADGEVTKCQIQAGGKEIKQSDGSTAWLYPTASLGPVPARVRAKPAAPTLGKAELARLIKQHQAAVTERRLALWSKSLGVSAASLKRYGVGVDPTNSWASWPMYDGTFDGKGVAVPCGIRLRDPATGDKLCVRGSRNGLFLPIDYEARRLPDGASDIEGNDGPLLLLMPEGPTDCCAAFDLGFRAVGRPNNGGGVDAIRRLLAAGDKQDVVIVADRDPTKYLKDGTPHWPGWEGALSLASNIAESCERLRVVRPPKEVKDLRDWLRQRSARVTLIGLMLEAVAVDGAWISEKKTELRKWKAGLRRKVDAA